MRDGGKFLGALSTVAAASVLLICGVAACGLLWNAVVPVPQRLLLVVFGGKWSDLTMIARAIAGTLPLCVSFSLMCSTRMRTAFVRLLSRNGEEECVKKSRYFNAAFPQKMRLLFPAMLGAALLVAVYEVMTGWIRVMPNGSHVWAIGVIPVEPRWVLVVVLAVFAGMVALYYLSVGGPRLALAAAAIGGLAVLAFCAFDCSPGMLPLLFSLLFGLNMIGAVFSVWGDEPRALRVLACVELVPVLTLVASVGEQMAGLLVDGTSAHGMPEVVLLAALDGCSVLALFLRAFVTRGRYVEESREEKCVLVSPESLAEQLGPFNLSERELFVLMESLRGRSLASIAKELGVSRSTAGTYRLRAYAKAGVESLDEARAKFTTPKSVQTAEVMGRGPCPVRRSVAALGLVAWFALAGSLLLPWSGSRAWLCDEVWSTLPSLLLMLASCYLIFSNQVDSRKMRRGMLRYAAVCSALIVPVSCALSGRIATTGILPVLFSSLALSALVVGFESVVNLARRAHCGIVECAAVAAMVLSVSSATAVWYTVAIATSAAILCTLLAWVVRTEKRGDETSMPEDVRTGDSKTMTQTVGFFPRREQAFCIIAGFSMVGWGFYQINEVAVLNVDAIASLPPIFFACSTLLYTSALFFIWNRYVRNREVLLASFIAIIWFASAMVIIGLQYLGCHNDASPMGHMMIGFPCMVLAGMSVDALLSFQEQHSCKSFRFAYPVVLLVGLAIWCGGIVVADAAKAFASQEISTVCIVAGGAMGFVGLVDTGRTLHKRTALSSTSSEAVIDVLIGAGLTPSEARVALLVCSGLAAREAAGVLCVECSTVRSHLRSVYAKLAVHTRAELEVAVAALVREHIR